MLMHFEKLFNYMKSTWFFGFDRSDSDRHNDAMEKWMLIQTK